MRKSLKEELLLDCTEVVNIKDVREMCNSLMGTIQILHEDSMAIEEQLVEKSNECQFWQDECKKLQLQLQWMNSIEIETETKM